MVAKSRNTDAKMIPKALSRWVTAFLFLGAFLLLAGCGSLSPRVNPTPRGTNAGADPNIQSDVLQPRDIVQVTFSGVSSPPKDIQDQITADGMITLAEIGAIKIAGLSRAEAQAKIHREYVEVRKLYADHLGVHLTSQARLFYVQGEVKAPNGYSYMSDTTVRRAIARAGGFTDFANRTITLTRSTGEKISVDCREAELNSARDLPVYPGDLIDVPRGTPFSN